MILIAICSDLDWIISDLNKIIQKTNYSISVCSKLGEMVDAETPPDFVLDTTSTGVFSDAIKSLTNSLGIPSVATSYGGVGELRY